MAFEFEYKLSRKAETDLDETIAYIAVTLENPKAAADFVDKLTQIVSELSSFPESGEKVVNDFLADNRVRKRLVGNYVLYYLPDFDERRIYILRIVFGGRDMEQIFKELI